MRGRLGAEGIGVGRYDYILHLGQVIEKRTPNPDFETERNIAEECTSVHTRVDVKSLI